MRGILIVKNFYLEYGESQRVSQLVLVDDQGVPTAALHVDAGERVQLRVHPVEALVQQVLVTSGGCVRRRPLALMYT